MDAELPHTNCVGRGRRRKATLSEKTMSCQSTAYTTLVYVTLTQMNHASILPVRFQERIVEAVGFPLRDATHGFSLL